MIEHHYGLASDHFICNSIFPLVCTFTCSYCMQKVIWLLICMTLLYQMIVVCILNNINKFPNFSSDNILILNSLERTRFNIIHIFVDKTNTRGIVFVCVSSGIVLICLRKDETNEIIKFNFTKYYFLQ
jgi:hypothetical protein